MVLHFIYKSKGARCYNTLLSFLLIIIFFSFVAEAKKNEPVTINIGAIIDVDSRVGKEHHVAMNMAVGSFNNVSNSYRLSLHFRSIGNNPIQAVSAAEELIREKQVKVIIGLQTWEQTVLVADSVGKKHRIPILSLGHSSYRAMFLQQRWPFLLPMVPNSLDQASCIARIIGSFKWRKVVVIYEENIYGGGDSELITALSETLQDVDADIESHLALPSPSSVPDPEVMIRDEMTNLLRSTQSRVFVVLRSSSSLVSLLFQEAKKTGLMGRDSAWILGDSLSDLLHSFEPSVLTSMQGFLGIKSHFREDTKPFSRFKREFQLNMRLEFPDEQRLEPGIHSLRAYDAITALSKAVVELGSNAPESFLKVVRSNSFTGLSGEVHLHGDEALSGKGVFQIVNIVGRSYKELAIWSPRFGFSDSIRTNPNESSKVESMKELGGLVNWPGELNRVPKGWTMPTDAKPMKIGVPKNTTFPDFVMVPLDVTDITKYDGFCIDVFREVLKIVELEYALPFEFVPYNDSYDSLVDHILNKEVSAIVGDMTILSNRSKYVDFTHPFAESGLSMTVKVKHDHQKAWIFMKPFTNNMWFVTFSIMFYTMFVVWFMEHQTNPQFKGSWKDQLATAMWFTFSTIFFAHRETIKSNYSKAVLVVWLFLVFVLTSSYTANLTSMLTVPRLEPNVTNIEWIRQTNAPVGCDSDSYVNNYLRDVLKLRNIKTIVKSDLYPEEFNSGNITAAFLELPYQKVFLQNHCKDYTVTGPTYRNGGLGFVFEKGSPIARDFSKAILRLLENGTLALLQNQRFGSSMNCSNSDGTNSNDSLQLDSFWGLFLISACTTTICFLIFIVRLLRRRRDQNGDVIQGNGGIKGIVDLVVEKTSNQLRRRSSRSLNRARTFTEQWSSSGWDLVSPVDPSEQCERSQSGQLKQVYN